MKFSRRYGTKKTGPLQIGTMNQDLKMGLWNAFYINFIDAMKSETVYGGVPTSFKSFTKELWCFFLKKPADSIPYNIDDFAKKVESWFFYSTWEEIYDFLEAVVRLPSPLQRPYQPILPSGLMLPSGIEKFIGTCTSVLEECSAGYRFIGKEITPISDKNELKEITDALAATQGMTQQGVHIQLSKAQAKLADRLNPDYEGSMKDSISAVEALAAIITAQKKPLLSDALDKINEKIEIHPALKKALDSLYGYTSDEEGVRHGMIKGSKCDLEDAKFMLSTCAAFINYLISKATKAGIKL